MGSIIFSDKIEDISPEVLREDGKLKILPADYWKKYDLVEFRTFCHFKARYGIPTYELMSFLTVEINGRHALEIGAGSGDLGSFLNIRMTDDKQQETADLIQRYNAMQQPCIKYPDDIEKIEAVEAVKKYKPQVVIASWVTTWADRPMPYGSSPYGIKENEIIDLVDTYILIGNLDTHGDKPIMKIQHKVINEPWILSRGRNPENNRIFIWNKKHE